MIGGRAARFDAFSTFRFHLVLRAFRDSPSRLGMPPGVGGSYCSSDFQHPARSMLFRPADRPSHSTKPQNPDLDPFAFKEVALGAYAKTGV